MLAFMIAVATSFSVKLVGDLPVAEALLIPLFPIFIVVAGRRALRPRLKVVLLLMGLWLFGQALTDIYRGTATIDWMRGNASILFFAMDVVCIAALLERNDRRKIIFIAGLAIGTYLVTRFHPSSAAIEEPWKFGYAYGSIVLVVLISCHFYRRRRYMMVRLLFGFIVFVNLIENYRSPMLNLLVAFVLVVPIIPERVGQQRLLPRTGSAMHVVVLVGMALGAGLAASSLVKVVTSSGLLSEEARQKNLDQANAGGLLLGGRPEIKVSIRAVGDSPILGHGSWPKEHKYVMMMWEIQAAQGMRSDVRVAEADIGGNIPSHSHLMGAWVWAGVLGAVFWFYIIWLVIKGLMSVSILRPPLAPIYAYLMVEFFWIVLFSPFGSSERIGEALVIVIITDLLDSAPQVIKLRHPSRLGGWKRQPFQNRGGMRIPQPKQAS